MATIVQEYSQGLTISIVGHIGLLLLLGANLNNLLFEDETAVRLPIEATVIDISAAREQREAEQRRQLELEQQRVAEQKRREEQTRLAEQQRQQKAEEQRIAEQRRKAEAEQQRIAEQRRKAEAEQQRVAEQKRKAEEARIAEQKRREEEARLAEQRRREEMERQFQREIAAEEERLAAISAGKLDIYKATIKDRVERNWVRPASAEIGLERSSSGAGDSLGNRSSITRSRCALHWTVHTSGGSFIATSSRAIS